MEGGPRSGLLSNVIRQEWPGGYAILFAHSYQATLLIIARRFSTSILESSRPEAEMSNIMMTRETSLEQNQASIILECSTRTDTHLREHV